MKKFNLNSKFLMLMLLFCGIVIFALKEAVKLVLGQTKVNGHDNYFLSVVTAIMLVVIALAYAYSIKNMLRQYLVHNGSACTITENGIQNTFTGLPFFIIPVIVPVEEIPWYAVKSVVERNNIYEAKIDTAKIEAGILAKLILRIKPYQFGLIFVDEDIKEEVRVHINWL